MRLKPVHGEWIDRQTKVTFQFEGQTCQGYAGDTITSALWAADVRLLGRSFKYHRPRGVLSLSNHDINAMMQDGQHFNVRADVEPIRANRVLTAVNTFGGVAADSGRWLNSVSAFLPVGFYYKAFHTKKLFPMWERLFRRLTGLGKIDFSTPRVRTPKCYNFCDVLVIGAGPSGIAAALAAADAGADVVVVDENARAGGSGSYQRGGQQGNFGRIEALLEAIAAHPRVRLVESTLAGAYYADHWVPLVDAEKLTKMRAKSVIVASGAFEQPAVFHNNDLPGVMLASAAQRLMYRYAVQPMQRAVVLVANADGYRAALDLDACGVQVAAVVDLRHAHRMGELDRIVRERGIKIFSGHCILEAQAAPGGKAVAAAVICPFGADGQAQTTRQVHLECDGIVMSVGWAPAANLLYQAGAKMQFADAVQQFVPEQLPDGVFACGRVNGVYDFDSKLFDGERAGHSAAAYAGHAHVSDAKALPETESPSHPWPIVAHPKAKNFVDFDEDLQLKDFENAVQEGFDNIELLKRYTTVGMGPSQGKHSNMNALRILARLTGKTPGQVGTTTARPFFHPVPLSHLAGRGFSPERETPLHHQHRRLGAVFMPVGVWQRPAYYATAGQDRIACIRAEVAAVRNGVGMIDVGTLGKIEIYGPDAAEFLERIYISRYANLKVGMSRYAVMCDESGVVIDDGVVARLGEQHFYFTTTTSGSANIYRELQRLNTLWQLDCGLVNLTGAMAAVNLAGPASAVVLAQLTDCDLSSAAFPYLAVRDARVAGIAARLMRVGFVGEWGYEIHVPADYANALWEALWNAGKSTEIRAFGVEAQRLLRLEKGHIIIGQDTDGLTTPYEANLGWAVKMDKPFFIGQRSLRIIDSKPLRQTLVGFILGDGYNGVEPQECHLVIHQGNIAGRVTSIAWSPSLARHIGLVFVRPDLAAEGCPLSIRLSDGSMVMATVHATPFYDPKNARQKNASGNPDQGACRMTPLEPLTPLRRSPLQRVASVLQPQWGTINDMTTTLQFDANDSERMAALGIVDMSFLSRCGLKGPNSCAWIAAKGLPIPEINSWGPLPNGGLIARLGVTEFLIEDSTGETTVKELAQALTSLPDGVYPVLRQDGSFAMTGAFLQKLLRQTCSLNFNAFDLSTRPLALTTIVGVSVVIIPTEVDGQQRYRIWFDGTYGGYLWQTLLDIAGEQGGGAVGLTCFTQKNLNYITSQWSAQ